MEIVSKSAARHRNQTVEMGRILSAFGIVAFHTKVPGSEIFYAGLIFFVFLTPYMESKSNWARVRSVRFLARLFLIPWGFWMIFYGLMNHLAGNPVFPAPTVMGKIFGGTSIHLWFMPAMFLCLVALNALKRYITDASVFWGAAAVCSVMIASLPWTDDNLNDLGVPLYQWLQALPAFMLGVVLGLRRDNGVRTIVGGLIAVSLMLVTLTSEPDYFSVTYPVGFALVAMFILLPERMELPEIDIQQVASTTLGVYLSHISFVRIFNAVIGREMVLTAVAAFFTSIAFVFLMRRYIPFSRYVLG